YVELEREAGPQPGESAASFKERIQADEKRLAEGENQLNKRRTDFNLESAGKRLEDRVGIARALGLSRLVLEILDGSDEVKRNPELFRDQLVMLLLKSGYLNDARTLAGLNGPSPVNLINDLWLNVLLAAADNDYDRADDYLARILRDEREKRSQTLLLSTLEMTLHGNLDLGRFPQVVRGAGQQANLRTLRALLTLEKGDNAAALEQFRHALAISLPGELVQDIVTCWGSQDPLVTLVHFPQRYRTFSFEWMPMALFYQRQLESASRLKRP
ncbi:MAG: hypothetical protein AB7K24_33615, partial [Gemmataceae bacterium]